MNIKEIIKDSILYSSADWFNFVLLGIILLLTDLMISVDNTNYPFWLNMLFLFLIIFLGLLEAGYIFRVLEETLQGSTRPPKFNRFVSLLIHGIKETIVSIIYILVPLILFIIGLDLLPDNLDFELSYTILTLFLVIGLISAVFISFFYQGALINMAHNKGTLKSGFNFPQIWSRMIKIGIKKLFFISFLILIILYIVRTIIFDTLHYIPIIGDIIASLLVAPFLIIFTTRMLGLIGRSADNA